MNFRKITPLAAALFMAGAAEAQITFSTTGSSWNGVSSFFGDGSVPNPFRTDDSPDGTTAFAAGSVNGSQYVFGFAKEAFVNAGSYDLSSTDLGAGTALTLNFTGFSALPRYVAYTGGVLTGYTFNSGTGNLTISATTVNPVASASDSSGSVLNSAFGLIIETGGSYDFQGTVFRTDGFWGDIATLNNGYSGELPLAGVNFNGTEGANVTFNAYLTIDFLNSIGINSPAECAAYLQKAGVSNYLTITRQLFGYSGSDPLITGGGYTFGGASTLDFNGSGVDNYLLATYANDTWSAGNIGVAAVPEPSTYALVLGLGAVAWVAFRRKRTTAG
ncbi:MAG: PEP-CTERM sorting domain-containing protein [Opitutaceae bacterium]|nr:PEP-CTERM sorting domain-containing protein [Opitutaceae bacterium]